MKLKLPLLLASALFTQICFAQFSIGPKAGVNITKIQGKSFKDEFEYGYSVGAFLELGLGKTFSLQPELLFNQYQSKVDSNFSAVYQNAFSNASSGKVKLNYLAIPVLLNYKLGSAFALQAGPQFGVLINKDKSALQNGKNAFKSGDLSMLLGAQIKLSHIRIMGRYAVGLSDINDVGNNEKWKSQAIQLSLGLSL